MRSSRATVVTALLLALSLGNAVAQQQPSQPQQQEPQAPVSPRLPFPGSGTAPSAGLNTGRPSDQLNPTWVQPSEPGFTGFPVFPSRLSGYGNYPLTGGQNAPAGIGNAPGIGAIPLLPPAEPEPPGWPAWIRAEAKKPLPFAPDVGLLVRNGDRVWWREVADEPFVPLFFHDKFATLPIGGEVEVRQTGEFELLLHSTTRIETRGPTSLRLGTMDEKAVQVQIAALSWLRIHVYGRKHTLELPDGSKLVIEPPPEEEPGGQSAPAAAAAGLLGLLLGLAPQATSVGASMIEIIRADEPGSYAGRATITNLDGPAVTLQHAFGESVVEPGQRVTFFLSRPAAPAAAGLVAGDAQVERRSGEVTCRSGAPTDVVWCGAQISLAPGSEVTFESLQGEAFPAAPRRVPSVSAPAR